MAHVPKFDAHHVARRTLARSKLDVPTLGWIARSFSRGPSHVELCSRRQLDFESSDRDSLDVARLVCGPHFPRRVSGVVLFPIERFGAIARMRPKVVRLRFGENVRRRECEPITLDLAGVLRNLWPVRSRSCSHAATPDGRPHLGIVSDVPRFLVGDGIGVVLVGVCVVAGRRETTIYLFSVLTARTANVSRRRHKLSGWIFFEHFQNPPTADA